MTNEENFGIFFLVFFLDRSFLLRYFSFKDN